MTASASNFPAPYATDAAPTAKRASSWAIIGLILLLLACCGAGGWWWLHRGVGDAPADAGPLAAVTMDSPPGIRGGRGGGGGRPNNGGLNRFLNRLANAAPDGVAPSGTGYLIRAGNTRVNVLPGRGNQQWQFNFFYVNESITTPDQLLMVQAMLKTHDADVAAKAGVTDDQKQKLRKLPPGGVIIEPSQRETVATLFNAWLAAAGRTATASSTASTAPIPASAKSAETALVAAVSAIGQKQLQPSRDNSAARAKQIHDILGDAVIAKLQ